MSDKETIAKLREALEFYASGNHVTSLSYTENYKKGEPNGPGWWSWKRGELTMDGFDFMFEASNGTEHFVEDGSKAREALQELYCE